MSPSSVRLIRTTTASGAALRQPRACPHSSNSRAAAPVEAGFGIAREPERPARRATRSPPCRTASLPSARPRLRASPRRGGYFRAARFWGKSVATAPGNRCQSGGTDPAVRGSPNRPRPATNRPSSRRQRSRRLVIRSAQTTRLAARGNLGGRARLLPGPRARRATGAALSRYEEMLEAALHLCPLLALSSHP